MKQPSQSIKEGISERLNLAAIFKGILVSYMITFPIFAVFAYALTYTSFPEKFVSPLVVFGTILSIMTAGAVATRKMKSKGWLNGGVVGLIYMLILYLFSSIVFKNFSIDRYVAVLMIIGLLTGCIGGIIGINFKTKSRSRVRIKKKF